MIDTHALNRAGEIERPSVFKQVLRCWTGFCANEIVDVRVATSKLAAASMKLRRMYNGLRLMPRLFQPVAALNATLTYPYNWLKL